MDDLWDPPNHPATEEINCRNDGCQCGLSLAYDEIEEKGLNEKSCIQVLRILISKADADIIELEEELMDLLSQLACTDEEFSNTLSMFLRVKIDILDLSIRKLKDDAGDFLSTSREPAESLNAILKSLFCRYLQKKDEQEIRAMPSRSQYDNHLGCDSVKAQGDVVDLIFPEFESRCCQSPCGHEGSPAIILGHSWLATGFVGAYKLDRIPMVTQKKIGQ